MPIRTRLAATVVALALGAPIVAGGPVQAEPAAPEAQREITIKAVEPGDNEIFFAKGRVRPSYENRFAIMQRKLEDAKRWKTWRKFKTNDESRYRKEIKPLNRVGVVCYRVKVKASGRFETSFSPTVCIRSFRG